MATLLYLQLSSPSSSRLLAGFRRSGNCEIDLRRSIRDSFECHASRGRFRFRAEEELFRDEGFGLFEFGNRKKKKRPWWLDDDDDDDDYGDFMDGDDDWSMVFEVFRTVSWMLAPIGISLLLGTDSDSDSNAGLMALAVPLVQSLFSLVVNMVLSRQNISRPMKRSRRESFSRSETVRRTRKSREEGDVDKGGYKSWMVGDADSNITESKYGGWDDLEKQKEFRYDNPSNEKQFERKASRRWQRVKEKPLFLRMLIATFPFLSSWTKFLF